MKKIVGLTLLLAAVACSAPPQVSPQECTIICGAKDVCKYSDDVHGSGTCVCKDEQGDCPGGDGGSP